LIISTQTTALEAQMRKWIVFSFILMMSFNVNAYVLVKEAGMIVCKQRANPSFWNVSYENVMMKEFNEDSDEFVLVDMVSKEIFVFKHEKNRKCDKLLFVLPRMNNFSGYAEVEIAVNQSQIKYESRVLITYNDTYGYKYIEKVTLSLPVQLRYTAGFSGLLPSKRALSFSNVYLNSSKMARLNYLYFRFANGITISIALSEEVDGIKNTTLFLKNGEHVVFEISEYGQDEHPNIYLVYGNKKEKVLKGWHGTNGIYHYRTLKLNE
jgi:hypothetical protein